MLRSDTGPAERSSGSGLTSEGERREPIRKSRRRPDVREQIAALPDLPREELVGKWAALYGSPPPRGIKRPLLERAVAWHLQAKAHGGHSRQTLRELKAAAETLAGQGRRGAAGPDPSAAENRLVPPSAPSLTPGMRLIREWQGRTYVVEVVENGFMLDGKQHRSLSAIARRITGARWSGPRFFGL